MVRETNWRVSRGCETEAIPRNGRVDPYFEWRRVSPEPAGKLAVVDDVGLGPLVEQLFRFAQVRVEEPG